MRIQLDHINMTVADLAVSQDWYGKIFGFETVESGIYNEAGRSLRWAILKKDESMLCVYEDPELKSASEEAELHHRIAHFGIRLMDSEVDSWEARLVTHQVEVAYGGVVNYPHSKSWYVIDPSGYEIEVSHWPRGLQF